MRGIGTQRQGVSASSCRGAAELDHEGYVVPSHVNFYGFGKCLSKINFIFVSKILDHPFDILNKVRKVGICPEFDPFILHKTP